MDNYCQWAKGHELSQQYHHHEWGVPVHDDKKHFEYLLLDSFQAGLSWITILKKRDAFRLAFANFEVDRVADFTPDDVEKLMQNASIVRNRLKIISTIKNAKSFIEIQKEFGSFDNYIWQFVGNKTIQNCFSDFSQIPAKTKEAENMSKALIKRGFRFVGPTICYAYMQASGMVNDHEVSCFRYNLVSQVPIK